ncbi:uncharacterized protein Z518_08830 [Rhinocladiella mackenziei CBS 650.93]|uniref:Fungal STAND N-terminal Goodbye domain-containing protein n=1 Tax=Rhinocladiella mackenziei CBS 650.93 TaxID=1442369 RepID=A0A0D2FLL6_9EURO|nr:uncharacterized protein Z518_08830 [Rhinocladiella mackenziei CBS 650.93]KIX02887.1 hypothetical protein Z518_08830 [Rhinocladiella mackenziei CBS 650.93]
MPPNRVTDLAAAQPNTLLNFAWENAGAADQTTLMMSIVDDAKEQREQEKLRLQSYYSGNGAPSLEIQFLGNESTQLSQVLQQLAPNDPNKVWTFQDFQNAVEDAKVKWESKKRLGGGKVQATFHKLMGKFKTHSNLFSFMPSGNEYTSIICWACSALVNASVQHTDTVEELANVMEVVNEAASMVELESGMFKGEVVQRAVAKFYTAVFLLLGDVAMWYNSKSWEKFRNSFHEGFHKQFASALQNVQRMSAVVGRTASMAAAAEGRHMRLTVEELRQEIMDERAGLSGALRRIAQSLADQFAAHAQRLEEQSKLDHEETRRQVLAAVNGQMQHTEASYRKIINSGWDLLRENLRKITYDQQEDRNRKQLMYMQQKWLMGPGAELETNHDDIPSGEAPPNIGEMQKLVENLLVYITKGARMLDEPEEVLPTTTHERVAVAIGTWLQSPDSAVLYLEYPAMSGIIPQISLVTYRLVLSADSLNAPIISFFCRPSIQQEQDEGDGDSDPLVGLVYSLTYQILSQLPSLQSQSTISADADFEGLDATSWKKALQLFEKALKWVPPLMLCVIDRLEEFERRREDQVKELIDVLRNQVKEPSKTFKVLFTSSNRSFALLDSLPSSEIDIVETNTHSFRGGGPGRTLFIV